MIEQLKKYVEENMLISEAIEGFWIAFDNWKKDDPHGYDKIFGSILVDNLNILVQSVRLQLSPWPKCDYNHIVITLLIEYNNCQLGNYRYCSSLSFDVYDDDILEIYPNLNK